MRGLDWIRTSVRFAFPCVMLLVMVLVAGRGVADPIVPPFYHPYDPGLGVILWIAFTNLPINLLLVFAALLVVFKLRGKEAGDVDPMFPRFGHKVVAAAVFITVVGALTDYSLVYSWDHFEGAYLISMEPLLWALASGVIFVSIFLSFAVILGIRLLSGALASAAITAVSPLSWLLLMVIGSSILISGFILMSFLCLVFSAVLAILLKRRHESLFISSE